ncbi:hypothetical protein [Flindersiella endophytica]
MSLERLAEAVVEVAAKISLGNHRFAERPELSAKERILARRPSVPFGELTADVVARLSTLVEAAHAETVERVDQTLRNAVLSQDLLTEGDSVGGLFDALIGQRGGSVDMSAAYTSLMRACCWEIITCTRALWNHLNAPTALDRPRWRQLYSGGPIRSLAAVQLETGPYIVAGGENGAVMLDQFTGTTAQVDRHDTFPVTAVATGIAPVPIAVLGTSAGEVRVAAIPSSSAKFPAIGGSWQSPGRAEGVRTAARRS